VRLFATLFSVPLTLLGCDAPDKFEARDDRLRAALEENDKGLGSKAVWLVKRSSIAPDDRTAVFFGYADNRAACEEFVAAFKQADPSIDYVCDTIG
jgi:hypothetical protein